MHESQFCPMCDEPEIHFSPPFQIATNISIASPSYCFPVKEFLKHSIDLKLRLAMQLVNVIIFRNAQTLHDYIFKDASGRLPLYIKIKIKIKIHLHWKCKCQPSMTNFFIIIAVALLYDTHVRFESPSKSGITQNTDRIFPVSAFMFPSICMTSHRGDVDLHLL